MKDKQENMVLIRSEGKVAFAKIRGRSSVTKDGEAIEGEALNEAGMKGVGIFLINTVRSEGPDHCLRSVFDGGFTPLTSRTKNQP
ncbi:hypothetical protein ACMYSN_04885 [Klebsiella sp. R445]